MEISCLVHNFFLLIHVTLTKVLEAKYEMKEKYNLPSFGFSKKYFIPTLIDRVQMDAQ